VRPPSQHEILPPRSPPPLPGPVWLTQTWRDMVFVHWPVAPASVLGLFPDRTWPATLGGVTYVGIVAFAIPSTRVAVLEIGSTYELNVRLYSMDDQGRHGVVFLSMDVTRPDMVLVARVLLRLPYFWSHLEPTRPDPAVSGFRLRRLPSRLSAAVEIEVDDSVSEPSPLEVFFTSRWGLHTRTVAGTTWVPIAHPPLPVHRARLRQGGSALLTAGGVRVLDEAPVSVLWSPGLDVQVGRPARMSGRRA